MKPLLSKKFFIILIVVLLLAAGIFFYKKFQQPSTKVLETAEVRRGDIRGVIVETGIIKPQVGALVKVGTRATGTIVKMSVKIGDTVKKGQLIALIDDREIQRAIEQQKASLESAESTFSQVELTYPERIREAKANFEYARINYEREQELLKHEYTTRDAVDKARSQYEATEANLNRLRDEYKTERSIAAANVKDMEAQLRQQQTRLTYTRIYSPMDGIVSDVTAQEGETMVAGLQVANLVTVLNPGLLEMWIYVDETDVGRVKIGHEVEYYVDTFPEKLFHGMIQKVYPQPIVKENIVYYLAIVKVSPEDALFLRPEMTTHARVIYSGKSGVLVAPNDSIKYEGGRQVVYRLTAPETVQKTEVKTGLRGENVTEILSGLHEGDKVATKLILPAPPKASGDR